MQNNNDSKNPGRNPEVHTENCRFLSSNSKYLGDFYFCSSAVAEAKKIYRDADGCRVCCSECHKE